MKIHILTAHFFPQLHPRAFRASELAIEFARRGHQVIVSNLTTLDGYDYDEYTKQTGVTVNNLELYRISSSQGKKKQNTFFQHILTNSIEYFLSGDLYRKSRAISKSINISEDTDAVISLSTPFMNIRGLCKYIKHHGKRFVAIADSGDPFYYSKQYKKATWFYFLEKDTYRCYDYLTIPTENAVPLYSPLIDISKIKIIPQGFRMDNLNLYQGDFKGPVRIAYAGVFYWDIRNPEFLFKYLNQSKTDFELFLFMRNNDSLVDELLEKYPCVREKTSIKSLPHDELLFELSRMHFLVNIENISNTQIPSKLIDYGMVKRPIFSCNSSNFSESKLESFLKGDYRGAYEVDIQKYNIVNIANQFEELINSALYKK